MLQKFFNWIGLSRTKKKLNTRGKSNNVKNKNTSKNSKVKKRIVKKVESKSNLYEINNKKIKKQLKKIK